MDSSRSPLDHGIARVVVTSAVVWGYCMPVVIAGAATDMLASRTTAGVAGIGT